MGSTLDDTLAGIIRSLVFWFFNARYILTSALNPLLPGGPFLYHLKTSENLRFSDVSRWYKMETPGRNGLLHQSDAETLPGPPQKYNKDSL